jgi:hypothetical protein
VEGKRAINSSPYLMVTVGIQPGHFTLLAYKHVNETILGLNLNIGLDIYINK